MEAFKKGRTFWIERCKDDEGIVYFLHRFNSHSNTLGDSFAVAESRDEQKIIEAWEALEKL